MGDICRTADVTLLQVVITHVEDLAERLVPCEGNNNVNSGRNAANAAAVYLAA